MSHLLTGPMPLWPAQTLSQTSSADSPSEVTNPNPVMTTRRLDMCGFTNGSVRQGAAPDFQAAHPLKFDSGKSYLLECVLM